MFPYEPTSEQNNCDMTHSDFTVLSILTLVAVDTTPRKLPDSLASFTSMTKDLLHR
jgi:hypothetical protein